MNVKVLLYKRQLTEVDLLRWVTCRALIGSYSLPCGAEPSHRVVLNI